MIRGTGTRVLAVALSLLLAMAASVSAQITTGTVSGTIKDAQGGVIPGATVVLTSEARGTKTAPVVTNATGDFVIPNVTADTYTLEVTMAGFKTSTRKGLTVSGGERVALTAMTLEAGGQTEVVNVTAEAPLIQAQSGERSFAVSSSQIENLPISHGNFTSVIQLVPGVRGGANQNGARVGGASQDNIQMDGISAMDTGNNGQMLNMNVESIAEVKVLTQGYQAEYGRSSGLQITAVTKGGSNRFHGSLYRIDTSSKWNSNSWTNQKNGNPKTRQRNTTQGYSFGGPVGKPGGSNKLFFFYSHEYRPSSSGGALNKFRVPTAEERLGIFTNSTDDKNAPIPQLKNPAGGTFANKVIPASSQYAVGLAILNRYPLPNRVQSGVENYNLEIPRPVDKNLLQQPAVRVDYQFSPSLRVTGKFSGQREKQRVVEGTMPGFNDVLVPYPYISNYGITANYTLNSTTFFEATYGSIKNELAGGGSGGILTNDSANRLNGLADFPLIFPNAGKVTAGSYQEFALNRLSPIYYQNGMVNLPPQFSWGSRIGNQPPNQQYPGWLNVNKTQDFAASLTKVAGRHTMKAGFYNNHSFKAQNTGAGGLGVDFAGSVNFGNDTNNPLDTGFGYANALVGVFTQYRQASVLIEGNMLYNNTEFYLQDNWKVNGRLTLDYGMRFTRQQPQYDSKGNMSNFFPDQWSLANAPLLYVPGCSNGAVTCSGNTLNAKNPATGAILTAQGAANTQAAIGTPVIGTGSLTTNGIKAAGQGISKYSYVWPTLAYGPRVGAAYDLTGNQSIVVRGGGGLFYDRPDGNTVFSIPLNPPFADSADLRNSTLQTLGKGLTLAGVPGMSIFQYDAKIPSSVQWNAGVQMALPWSSSLDVSYVGNHGYNRLGNFQAGSSVNLNAVDLGTAYAAAYQDPTKATKSAVPGADALTDNLLRPYRGLSNINQQTTVFHDMYHSVQTSFNRRFRNGVQFGVNYTLGISLTGNTQLQQRLQHDYTTGAVSIRADQAKYEELNKNLDNRRHTIKANWVWDMPDVKSENAALRAVGYVVNDWQLSGILTAGSGGHYDLGFSYQNDGSNKNLTGSPDYGARIKFVGDPGKGCSSNQYAQFNTASVVGPSYFSDGLESGRNIMQGCADHTVDLAIARNIRLGGGRQVQLRLDAFNAFDTVIFSGRQAQIQYVSPTNQSLRNSQTLADGSIDPTRLKPQDAGFGAVNGAQTLRNLQLTARFSF